MQDWRGRAKNWYAYKGKLHILIAAAAVAIGLGFLLVCNSPLITRGVYRIAFFLGLAAFAAIVIGPAGSWDAHMMGYIPSRATLILFRFVGIVPYLLLLETGFAGYRGFSSWMRYVSLALAALGGVAPVAIFLLARLRRRS